MQDWSTTLLASGSPSEGNNLRHPAPRLTHTWSKIDHKAFFLVHSLQHASAYLDFLLAGDLQPGVGEGARPRRLAHRASGRERVPDGRPRALSAESGRGSPGNEHGVVERSWFPHAPRDSLKLPNPDNVQCSPIHVRVGKPR